MIKRQKHIVFKVSVVLMIFFSMLTGCSEEPSKPYYYTIYDRLTVSDGNSNDGKYQEFLVKRSFTDEEEWTCYECHDFITPNPVKRELTEWHDEIIFDHDSENRWCLDCHDLNDRTSLRLASGKLLSFDDSHKLCGQCHGEKLRDWKAGVHGKRIGEWNGKKEYFQCVHCHDPHIPKFEKMKPEPPPVKQEDL